jgi:SAM-dependent MidA family methyltransferase
MKAKEALVHLINANNGFISMRDYMAFCLHDPVHGYYRTGQPLGKDGDFITAPEISQVFGELLGLWFISYWEMSQHPQDIVLLELGPGRGLLTRDILRTFSIRPEVLQTLTVHHVEIHPDLKILQREVAHPFPVYHHDTLEQALEAAAGKTLFLVANEFLDAFPIDQYIFEKDSWQRRGVTVEKETNTLLFATQPFDSDDLKNLSFPLKPKDGTIMESAPQVETLVRQALKHFEIFGGAGLFIDYGYDRFGFGDTLQAVQNHIKISPLTHPGASDLTVHVNFATLQRMAQHHPLLTSALQTQGDFLRDMAIDTRTDRLARHAETLEERQKILDATNRLVADDQMGKLFKVLQVWR